MGSSKETHDYGIVERVQKGCLTEANGPKGVVLVISSRGLENKGIEKAWLVT